MPLQITAAGLEDGLFDLPWQHALEEWPLDSLATLPRGISRHVVRFVRLPHAVVAVKEIEERYARREYETLQALARMEQPAVTPLAVVAGRKDAYGEPLPAALVTRHLRFSLPYRAVFSQVLPPERADALIDALAILLVRLHVSGVYWGDVSLSNTLFRRDAGNFQAYLVDAETTELYPSLSDGQRAHDLDLAHDNIAGELMDLEAGGLLDLGCDPVSVAGNLVERYTSLWEEITGLQEVDAAERWRVEERVRRLNALGFDVGELTITAGEDGKVLTIRPGVVEAGHHRRRLRALTGLDVGENQARRLLNDLRSYLARHPMAGDDRAVAVAWLRHSWDPIETLVPPELQAKLPPAELFHEVLEHRWYISERAHRDIPLREAIEDYVANVLPGKPDEVAVLGLDTGEIPIRVPEEFA